MSMEKSVSGGTDYRSAFARDDGTDSLTSAGRAWVDLGSFDNAGYRPGRGLATRCLWYLVSLLAFESGWLPLSKPKRWLLRLFGAAVGSGVVIKPHVRIKYPWRLRVGDHCWIGQAVWIDNIEDVVLGDHVCLSQQVYLCTGSHDYRKRTFDLSARPIRIEDGVWLGARCLLLGGTTAGANSIVTAGSVVARDVPAGTIVRGNPATVLRERPAPDV